MASTNGTVRVKRQGKAIVIALQRKVSLDTLKYGGGRLKKKRAFQIPSKYGEESKSNKFGGRINGAYMLNLGQVN